MTTPQQNAAPTEGDEKAAYQAARWAYGYYEGGSSGSADAIAYWDGVGHTQGGPQFTVKMLADHFKAHRVAAVAEETKRLREAIGRAYTLVHLIPEVCTRDQQKYLTDAANILKSALLPPTEEKP